MAMIYCSHCGTKISDQAKFCPVCGTELHHPQAQPNRPIQQGRQVPQRPVMVPPQKKSNTWIPWTITGICVVGILIFLAFWYADIDSPWGHPDKVEVEEETEDVVEVPEPRPVSNYAPPQTTIAQVVEEVAETVTPQETTAKPMRFVCSGTVENEGKEYPIRMLLSLNPNGSAVGKYAYESTLKRAGDKPSSWFRLNGIWNGTSDGPYSLHLTSINPADNKQFEDVNISIDENRHFTSGYIINKNVGSFHALQLDL